MVDAIILCKWYEMLRGSCVPWVPPLQVFHGTASTIWPTVQYTSTPYRGWVVSVIVVFIGRGCHDQLPGDHLLLGADQAGDTQVHHQPPCWKSYMVILPSSDMQNHILLRWARKTLAELGMSTFWAGQIDSLGLNNWIFKKIRQLEKWKWPQIPA